ncbi:GNAT family N-acetyltransferase [Parerythrobacter jejuensis]|uniref:GNAT family N-acetyltransferase n=1 Tax=Parerythrobacter jejuensis TaxID=795812 RepID=A0A845AS83_9SPHN|nr:GNAT family N-acetyltransferase [Parerythrobacter jejuensis]MXP31701.1 GNAT family N-acetyltransferase [Parerythrobacter jejuensis]
MSLRIESITDADFSEVADLWFQSWLSTGAAHSEGVTAAILEDRLANEPWDMWLARIGRDIAAFLAIDRSDACLSQLFVAPEFQGRGIGLELFNLAKLELPEGFWLRTDEGNSGARRFYDRHGLIVDRIEDGRAYYTWCP